VGHWEDTVFSADAWGIAPGDIVVIEEFYQARIAELGVFEGGHCVYLES
jgi:hypothetical protein